MLGQSAGAGSIAALLTRPADARPFRRAILQSLPGTYLTPALGAEVATEICTGIGRVPRAADLVAVPPDDLVAASRTVTASLLQRSDQWGSLAWSSTPFAPVVDGDVLPSAPWAALAGGAARNVGLLVGHCRDEYSLLAAHLPETDDAGVEALVDGLSPTPGARRYRVAYPAATAQQLRETALADWLHRMPALHLAEAADRGGARVWFYELGWGFGPAGASHGLDTLLLFGTADLAREVTAAGPDAVAATEELSRLVRSEQVVFAATGDPGWTRFSGAEPRTRVYRPEPALVAYPEERSRVLWRSQQFGVLDVLG